MIRLAAASFALALAALPAAAQNDYASVQITATDVADGIYMLQGAGGNIGLSTGEDGAFVIDDQFAPLSEKIMAAIKSKSDKPIKFLLNTHYHGDHTGGNEAMGLAGALIVAHDNVRKRLMEGLTRASGDEVPPAPAAALPVVTFSDRVAFFWNGQEINVVHTKPAHTDGDAVIQFKTANVVHTGDVFFNGGYPFIDLESGGDLDGYITAQETALSLTDDETRIIPGHGPLASKQDLMRSNAMLKDVRKRVQALIDRGLDEDAVVAADPLADLNSKWGQGFINGESMVRTAYKSLSR